MKPEPPFAPLAMRFYWAVAICLGLGLVCYVFVLRSTTLWDFKTCYSAAWLVRHGQNPYDNRILFPVSRPYDFPFAYPLLAAWLFAPFTLLNYSSAAVVWLGLMAAAWVVLALVWWRHFRASPADLWFPLLILLVFNLAIAKNLVTGNIATVESLLLWGAFLFLARGKLPAFVTLLLASSSFKMTPLVFLGLPLLHPRTRRWKLLLVGALAFGGYMGLSYALAPGWFKAYQANVAYNLQQWALYDTFNPSSYVASRRLVYAMDPTLSMQDHLRFAVLLCLLFVALVVFVSSKAIRALAGRPWPEVGTKLILYATLGYALIVPRFSDYSFVLVIPAALYVVGTLLPPARSRCLIAALLLPLPFMGFCSDPDFRGDFLFGKWGYWSLLMVFVCWCLLSKHILGDLKQARGPGSSVLRTGKKARPQGRSRKTAVS